jgi:hypothetical protein
MKSFLPVALVTGMCAPLTLSQVPSDWAPLVAAGQMLFTNDLPAPMGGIQNGYYPMIGNGFIAM